ncbi:acetyltransferase [Hymenobacter lutimineralis]|uniref:Acetyltransferase n=1 Tax=Hymenobacter lutimineralis TaxID=2606448 RepID=A0A5D6V7E5_9BACT|nr:acetyltransferase [Hymenobacter lutimineralis]TYZ11921.1 acetyltransferase [Hymenobacter lutimineralis]
MLVIGAKGHALEVLQVLEDAGQVQHLCFYDDVTPDAPNQLFGQYPVLHSAAAAAEHLRTDARVVVGIGGPQLRQRVAARFRELGAELYSAVAPQAHIGRHEVQLGAGLNIMNGVLVSNEVSVGEGTLLNARASLHHNVQVGSYCEISPGAQLLGHVRVGSYSQIGAGAIILPRVRIGHNVLVGAGAVVTADVPDNTVVAGVPARPLRQLSPLPSALPI